MRGQAMIEYQVLVASMMIFVVVVLVLLAPMIENLYCQVLSTMLPENTVCSTTTVTQTEKEKCNQGRGNGDDGCSPGNSDKNHDPNDPQEGPRK